MAIQSRAPMRPIAFPPNTPPPRPGTPSYRYATAGKWTAGKREGFADIAKRHGITTPWPLIFYNFQVRNPEEVNWALGKFLGCTKTLDGKNYCLDPSDARPVIYIPPISFVGLDTSSETARNLILNTLDMPEVSGVRFRLARLPVDLGGFQAVSSAVRARSILALASTAAAMPGIRAMYNTVFNYIQVRDPGAPTLGTRANIVHESVHAAMDLRRASGDVLRHEAAAHVAEALFYAYQHADPTVSIDPMALPVFHARAAMVIALDIWRHNRTHITDLEISETDIRYKALRFALSLVPEYAARGDISIGNDGV